MQAGARYFTSCEGTGDGPEALLPLKTSNAEAKSAVEKGRWVGLGFVQTGGGPMAVRSKTCLQCAVKSCGVHCTCAANLRLGLQSV